MSRGNPRRGVLGALVAAWLGLGAGAAVMRVGAEGPQPEADPFCRPTNRVTGGEAMRRDWPEGTRRMVARLAEIRASGPQRGLPCCVERFIPVLKERWEGMPDGPERLALRLQIGREWVRAGRPEEGLRELSAVDAFLRSPGGASAGIRESALRLEQALAWMRLGETENCVDGHRPESCVFPLAPSAFHRLPRGSRRAIEVLRAQLEAAPSDLRARWLLNLAHMTLGEWPQGVPESWLIPPSAFADEAEVGRFPDVAAAVGLAVNDLAGGCVVDDFDGDGFLDVVASSWGFDGPLRYFRNDGNGRFVERTGEAGLSGLVGGLNLQQTDYNNDGRLDLWVLRGGWLGTGGRIPNSLLRNDGDGTFTDVTFEAGLGREHPTQTSAWFDYDGDGWLDLFIGNETTDPADPDPCELYRNLGNGTFVECAAASGLQVSRWVKGVTAADYDNDGRPDLFLSCLDGPNLLFRNEGRAGSSGPVRFREVGAEAGVGEAVTSFPTWFFDYDNDGAEDLFVCGYRIRDVGEVAADYLGLRHQAARPRLYRNRGNGTFEDVTAAMGLSRVCHAMGSNFGDLDNDGWLDFYLGTGDPDLATLIPNRMFRNAGGRRFQEVTTSGGFGHLQKGHGVAFADLDHDGDQDVYQVLGGAFPGDRYPNALFLNPGLGGRFLKLQLVGTRANRPALGARVRVTVRTPAGRRTLHRTVTGGGSFGASPFRMEIGLGDARAVEGVEVRWPGSGRIQRWVGLEPDHAYRLREGSEAAEELGLKPWPRSGGNRVP